MEATIEEIANSFPNSKRAYLLNKLYELSKNMGLPIMGMIWKRIRN